MAQDFFAVGTLDLGFCSAVAVFGQAEHSVVILALERTLWLVQLDKRKIMVEEIPSSLWHRVGASIDLLVR